MGFSVQLFPFPFPLALPDDLLLLFLSLFFSLSFFFFYSLLECLDHSPAGSLHSSMQAAVILWIAAAIALFLCLLVSPILDSSLWAMEYLFHGSHTHRSICSLSFFAAPI